MVLRSHPFRYGLWVPSFRRPRHKPTLQEDNEMPVLNSIYNQPYGERPNLKDLEHQPGGPVHRQIDKVSPLVR